MLTNAPVYPVLQITDFARAKKFYTEQLSLKVLWETGTDFISFSAGNGTHIDMFVAGSPKSNDTAATFEVADIMAEMKNLRAKGVKFEEYNLDYLKTVDGVATWGTAKASWFKDTEGNILCLHEEKK